ncbi:hypothetical protein GQ42DRAFT_161587 [Ramicandelaber brevisporus]|nr:hypothetical protein GQ42DRAFT_161587 [Ramicandelaber brevisporus]
MYQPRLFLFLSFPSTNTFISYKYYCPCLLQAVLVFWSHRIPLLLLLSRGFRSVSACLSVWLLFPLVRSVADQDASCYRTFPIT